MQQRNSQPYDSLFSPSDGQEEERNDSGILQEGSGQQNTAERSERYMRNTEVLLQQKQKQKLYAGNTSPQHQDCDKSPIENRDKTPD